MITEIHVLLRSDRPIDSIDAKVAERIMAVAGEAFGGDQRVHMRTTPIDDKYGTALSVTVRPM